MKEFKCSSLGFKDGWKHIARTDDLLLDTVALHLHEAHGITELSPDTLAEIRNAFTPSTVRDAAGVADLVLQEYNCDRDPACTWRYFAQTEEVILAGAAEHAREKHGVGKFTPAMAEKVKKSIHPLKGGRKSAA